MNLAEAKQAWFILTVALVLSVSSPLAHAAAGVKPEATIADSPIRYQIQADGRHVVEVIGALRIETPQAVQCFAQVPIPYSSSLQKLDVAAASRCKQFR